MNLEQMAFDEHHEMIVGAVGYEDPEVFYAAYEKDGNNIPINNLQEVAVVGKIMVIGWNDYKSGIMTDPTWLTIVVEAEKMIKAAGESCKIFFEGIDFMEERGGVSIYRMIMGS